MTRTPRFDAYVMVDWSAAAKPVTGADSIWIALAERRADGSLDLRAPLNPPTRHEAAAWLLDALSDLTARGRRVLLGIDVCLGLPQGTAARLGLREKTWRGLWKALAVRLADAPDNANDRFALAGALNRALGDAEGPFWGHPAGPSPDGLAATKPAVSSFADLRLCETRLKGAKSPWQMHGAGSVGGQSLTAWPRLWALRNHPQLADAARVWPFETGFGLPEGDGPAVVIAEVYPSALPLVPRPGEVKDRAQVRSLTEHYAALDDKGGLAALFAAPPDLTPEQEQAALTEEGWVLPVAAPASPLPAPAADYIRTPEAIYAESFRLIRAETDLSRLPPSLHPLALRVVHACAMPEIVERLAWDGPVAEAGARAIRDGRPVLVDVQMVAHGLIRSRLQGNPVLCTLDAEGVAEEAKAKSLTRSAAGVERWLPHLDGAVVAIGNAPTALFRLLELLDEGAPRPAVILGFPVGFVGAAESKALLVARSCEIPYITLQGRFGGSALAAAAVNALAAGNPEEG